jgi:hypothetical protein
MANFPGLSFVRTLIVKMITRSCYVTRPQFWDAFKKCITKRHTLLQILTNHKTLLTQTLIALPTRGLPGRFWKEALK